MIFIRLVCKIIFSLQMKTAIYPGTFDPITLGHLDILSRAGRLFDKIIMAVAPNDTKNPMFPLEERMRLVRENIADMPFASAEVLEGLTVDFAKKHGATAIIRGLRVVSDFEFEYQLAQMNRFLDGGIETVLLMPSKQYFFTSSTIIKQVAVFDEERISSFVPPNVIAALKRLRK